MSQAGIINVNASTPGVLEQLTGNSGTAVPDINHNINVLGSLGDTTVGSGSTLTIVPGYQKYTSPTINFTATGNTTIFTNGLSKFVPMFYTFICDTVTNYSGDGAGNLGFTGPNYTDYVTAISFIVTTANQFSTDEIDLVGGSGPFTALPASTALVFRITTGATADVMTGRIVVVGFTI